MLLAYSPLVFLRQADMNERMWAFRELRKHLFRSEAFETPWRRCGGTLNANLSLSWKWTMQRVSRRRVLQPSHCHDKQWMVALLWDLIWFEFHTEVLQVYTFVGTRVSWTVADDCFWSPENSRHLSIRVILSRVQRPMFQVSDSLASRDLSCQHCKLLRRFSKKNSLIQTNFHSWSL